jgi:hypothetical protein
MGIRELNLAIWEYKGHYSPQNLAPALVGNDVGVTSTFRSPRGE